jgi:hypothetical protein
VGEIMGVCFVVGIVSLAMDGIEDENSNCAQLRYLHFKS